MILSASAIALVPVIVKFVLANDVAKITAQQAFEQLALKEVPLALFEHTWQFVLSHKEATGAAQPAAEAQSTVTENHDVTSPPAL